VGQFISAVDEGLLDHRNQCLLRTPTGFEQTRKVAALPQLGDAQLDGANPSIPQSGSIPVSVRDPFRRPLMALCADLTAYLELHEVLGEQPDGFPQKVHIRTGLVKELLECDA